MERIFLRIEGLFYLKSEPFYLHPLTSPFLHERWLRPNSQSEPEIATQGSDKPNPLHSSAA